jgi:hypothetical protein
MIRDDLRFNVDRCGLRGSVAIKQSLADAGPV